MMMMMINRRNAT